MTANRELVYTAGEDRGSLSIAKAARLTTVLPINFQTKRLGLELLRAVNISACRQAGLSK
jgi:hypothetical protein